MPEEYAYGEGYPLNGNPNNWSIEVLLRQAGSRLLHLKGVDQPQPEVHQGQQGDHMSAWMIRLSLPGEGGYFAVKKTQSSGLLCLFMLLMIIVTGVLPCLIVLVRSSSMKTTWRNTLYSFQTTSNDADDGGGDVCDVMGRRNILIFMMIFIMIMVEMAQSWLLTLATKLVHGYHP